MKKIKQYFSIFYITILVLSFFYVRTVLNTEEITIEEKDNSQKERGVEEVKPVNVTLVVSWNGFQQSFQKRMSNTNTFDDLLESLVEDGLFSYEKTEYTYGTEYDLVNAKETPEGYVWAVYDGSQSITFKTKGHKLKDDATYTLLLEERAIHTSEPQ